MSVHTFPIDPRSYRSGLAEAAKLVRALAQKHDQDRIKYVLMRSRRLESKSELLRDEAERAAAEIEAAAKKVEDNVKQPHRRIGR